LRLVEQAAKFRIGDLEILTGSTIMSTRMSINVRSPLQPTAWQASMSKADLPANDANYFRLLKFIFRVYSRDSRVQKICAHCS